MRASPVKAIGDLVTGFQGLAFEGAYCAEHEWGIDSLKTNLDIDSTHSVR
jgi:hypothetical protein